MTRKVFSTWGIIFLMLISIVGTAAANDGVTPTVAPTSPPVESTPYQNPIVRILSEFFGRETRPMLPTPTPTTTVTSTQTPTETPTVDPSATPSPTSTPPVIGSEEFAKQIAMYHQEGMGFGVLVKLYAMAEASIEACVKQLAATPVVTTSGVVPNQPACEAIPVEQLVSEFQGGTGMGQLFKEYGKAALLGVGHVKKALQKQQEVLKVLPTRTPTPVLTATPVPSRAASDQQAQNNQKSNNGNGQNNKPAKVKTPNPHGRK